MMVARQRMPGMCQREARPVGYGTIGWREGAMISDGGQSVAPQGHIGAASTQNTEQRAIVIDIGRSKKYSSVSRFV
jgi:hypothetical protein